MTRPGKSAADGGEAQSWLVTYSDMVTLLLAFFVLLFSFSTLDMERFQKTMLSLQEALGLLEGGRTVSEEPMVDDAGLMEDMYMESLELEQLMSVQGDLEYALREAGLDDGISFDLTERGLIIHFTDQVLFDSGEAELRPDALAVLDEVAPIMADVPNHIRIEGHTDNVPINTPRFPSNWELSTARATNVLQYLLEGEVVDPDRLTAAGYGEYRPVATNETEEGRAQNRRVDMVLLRLGAHEYEPKDLLDDSPGDSSGGSG